MDKLISKLKTMAINFRTLHRHLVGDNWETEHEKIGEYYEKIDEFEDSVVEQALSNEMKDVSIEDAIKEYDILSVDKNYEIKEAYAIIEKDFDELYDLFDKVKKEKKLTKDQISLFEEYQNWIKLEKDYKIKRKLMTSEEEENEVMIIMGIE